MTILYYRNRVIKEKLRSILFIISQIWTLSLKMILLLTLERIAWHNMIL